MDTLLRNLRLMLVFLHRHPRHHPWPFTTLDSNNNITRVTSASSSTTTSKQYLPTTDSTGRQTQLRSPDFSCHDERNGYSAWHRRPISSGSLGWVFSPVMSGCSRWQCVLHRNMTFILHIPFPFSFQFLFLVLSIIVCRCLSCCLVSWNERDVFKCKSPF